MYISCSLIKFKPSSSSFILMFHATIKIKELEEGLILIRLQLIVALGYFDSWTMQ